MRSNRLWSCGRPTACSQPERAWMLAAEAPFKYESTTHMLSLALWPVLGQHGPVQRRMFVFPLQGCSRSPYFSPLFRPLTTVIPPNGPLQPQEHGFPSGDHPADHPFVRVKIASCGLLGGARSRSLCHSRRPDDQALVAVESTQVSTRAGP
jgi:hypothetical protein